MSSRVVVIGRLIGAIAIAVALPALSTAQEPVLVPVEPPTKLEAFMARDGVVMICGSSRVGGVRGEAGTWVSVASRELTEARSGERALGVAVEVRSHEPRNQDRTSYIDLEEMPALLAALEYMAKVERTATALDRFEARYLTKGGLALSVFDVGSGMRAALSTGLSGTATTELQFGEFQRLRLLLQQAHEGLSALPAR